MTDVWIYTLGSVIVVSLISLLGVFSLGVKPERLERALLYLVSFSAGALLGDVFIHILPEIMAGGGAGPGGAPALWGGGLLFVGGGAGPLVAPLPPFPQRGGALGGVPHHCRRRTP